MSGWGCPNEIAGTCKRLKGRDCDPGIPGCVLHGRFVFSNPDKNRKPRTSATGASRSGAGAGDASHPRRTDSDPR